MNDRENQQRLMIEGIMANIGELRVAELDLMAMQFVAMQDELNKLIDPGWISSGYKWNRAVWVECAELLDHIGWKWWKSSEPNMGQAAIEMVDIWHFLVSWMISAGELEMLNRFVLLRSAMDEAALIDDSVPVTDMGELRDLIELLAAGAAAGNLDDSLTGFAMAVGFPGFGLDLRTLHRMYVGKSALNHFRQANGYKDGTYRKLWWDAEEDNVHLGRILAEMAANQVAPAEVSARIMTRLGEEYAKEQDW